MTLSGGDPLLWNMHAVVLGLRLSGFKVAVETQAHLWKDWLEDCATRMHKALRQSNFTTAAHEMYDELVGFGTASILVEEKDAQELALTLGS